MTYEAVKVIEMCDVIVGYKTYIELLRKEGVIGDNKEVYSYPMKKEIERAKQAITYAISTTKNVAVISNGDAGVYGMAGVVLEVLKQEGIELDVKIVSGMPAFCTVAALLGAPIMNDFAVISLSDLLTPFETIEERIRYAIAGDFVIILYNPASKGRQWQIKRIHSILLEARDNNTPVGIVWNAKRDKERIIITSLARMLDYNIDMSATVIIGNSSTFIFNQYMVTPRGYNVM
jgi:precorrin-3B C17-methyltransferase